MVCALLLGNAGVIQPLTAPAASVAASRDITSADGCFTYYVQNGNAAVVTEILKMQKEIVIPAEIDGYPVKTVEFSKQMPRVESITLPEGVRTFTSYVDLMPNLRELNLPESLEQLNLRGAFGSYQNLPYIQTYEAENGAYDYSMVGDWLVQVGTTHWTDFFSDNLILPEKAKRIGKNAIQTKRRVEYPSVTRISKDAIFYANEHIFSDALTQIDANAITVSWQYIPPSVTKIADRAFSGTDMHILGDKGSYIEEYCTVHHLAFHAVYETDDGIRYFLEPDGSACIYEVTKSGTELVIPAAVDGIPVSRIGIDCDTAQGMICKRDLIRHNIVSVTVSDGIRQISPAAFQNLPELRSITLPDSLENVQLSSFADTAWHTKQNQNENIILDGWLLQYNDGSEFHLPAGVKHIAAGALEKVTSASWDTEFPVIQTGQLYAPNLKTLTIPDTVTELQPQAIVSDALTALYIPPTVKKIAPNAIQPAGARMIQRIIFGMEDSAAEEYANAAGFTFIAADRDGTLHCKAYAMECGTETFSFGNSDAVFGSSYQLSDTHRVQLTELGAELDAPWNGSCFGIAAVTMLVHEGFLSPQMLDANAKTLHDVKPSEAAISLINAYQLAPKPAEIMSFHTASQTDAQRLMTLGSSSNVTHQPFMIVITTKTGGSHAVIGFGLEYGTWKESEYPYRVRIWDSNAPDETNGAYDLFISADGTEWEMPAYEIFQNGDTIVGRIQYAFSDITALDRSLLPAETVMRGDLDGDRTVTAKDVQIMQKYLLTCGHIADRRAADLDGNNVINAADFSLLKRLKE